MLQPAFVGWNQWCSGAAAGGPQAGPKAGLHNLQNLRAASFAVPQSSVVRPRVEARRNRRGSMPASLELHVFQPTDGAGDLPA